MAKELYWYESGYPGDDESGATPGVWHASDWNQTGRNWTGAGDPPLDQQGFMDPQTGQILPQYTGLVQPDGALQQTPSYNSAVDYGTQAAAASQREAQTLAALGGGFSGLAAGAAGAFGPTIQSALGGTAGAVSPVVTGGSGAAPGTLAAANAAGATGGDALGSLIAGNAENWGVNLAPELLGAGALGAAAASTSAPGAAGTVGAGALTAEQLATAKTAAATTAGGATALDRLLKGAATGTDLLKLGLGAAAVGAIAAENPDRTSTSSTQLPDWYTQGSKNALALADQYAALGPNSIAPLSENEKAAIQMAKDSAGNWVPLLDKSTGALDASTGYYDKAGALTASVPGYLDRAAGQIDAAMPYFTKSGQMADTVSGYLNRSGALADEAAGGIPSVNLSTYMNPYLDSVLAPIARRNEIAKAQALNDLKAKAGMRGAFGGSRSTLLEGQTAEAADRNMNEAEANIRSGAFTTGLSAAQTDLARKLAASGQFGTLGATAGNTANVYTNTGKAIADTAGTFNNMGAVAVGGANANTNIGRSLTDTAAGYKANAGALGTLTDADIARLTSTGATQRGVEQAKLDAPLTAISGYANALRGSPGSTNTTVNPEASKVSQGVGALATLVGANKAWG